MIQNQIFAHDIYTSKLDEDVVYGDMTVFA